MKKVKIDFDFSKWGQKGISVEVNGSKVAELHKHNTATDVYFGHYGGFNTFCLYSNNLTMYQEIKPREIWVPEQNGNLLSECYVRKSDSRFWHGNNTCKQIKFREVLDDEQ